MRIFPNTTHDFSAQQLKKSLSIFSNSRFLSLFLQEILRFILGYFFCAQSCHINKIVSYKTNIANVSYCIEEDDGIVAVVVVSLGGDVCQIYWRK